MSGPGPLPGAGPLPLRLPLLLPHLLPALLLVLPRQHPLPGQEQRPAPARGGLSHPGLLLGPGGPRPARPGRHAAPAQPRPRPPAGPGQGGEGAGRALALTDTGQVGPGRAALLQLFTFQLP